MSLLLLETLSLTSPRLPMCNQAVLSQWNPPQTTISTAKSRKNANVKEEEKTEAQEQKEGLLAESLMAKVILYSILVSCSDPPVSGHEADGIPVNRAVLLTPFLAPSQLFVPDEESLGTRLTYVYQLQLAFVTEFPLVLSLLL